MDLKRYVTGSLIIKKIAGPQNGGGDDGGGDGGGNEARDPYSRAERLYQDMVKARTKDEFRAAIDNAAPVNYDKNQQLMYLLEKAQTASEVRLAQ
jgi:hypothetical protein